jgi:hypothetical protein
MVGRRSRRQAWSTAATVTYSVSPRRRRRVWETTTGGVGVHEICSLLP